MGLRDDILNPANRHQKREQTVLNGFPVWVWGLTVRQRSQMEAEKVDPKTGQPTPDKLINFRAALLIKTVRESGEDGAKPVFSPGDEMYLNDLPAEAVEQAVEAALRLSGMGNAAMETARKNSETGDGGSSTDSPSPSDGAASNGALVSSARES